MPQTETVQNLRFVLLHVPKFVQRLLDIRAVVPAPPAREEAECIGGRHCRWARQRGDRGHALCQNTLVFESALRSSRACLGVFKSWCFHKEFDQRKKETRFLRPRGEWRRERGRYLQRYPRSTT